jgi:FtsZ-interacting cell division protein ZipA
MLWSKRWLKITFKNKELSMSFSNTPKRPIPSIDDSEGRDIRSTENAEKEKKEAKENETSKNPFETSAPIATLKIIPQEHPETYKQIVKVPFPEKTSPSSLETNVGSLPKSNVNTPTTAGSFGFLGRTPPAAPPPSPSLSPEEIITFSSNKRRRGM